MRVNGQARWTCRTHVSKVIDESAELEIAPLANLPIIKDLVTDMTEFLISGPVPKASLRVTQHAKMISRE